GPDDGREAAAPSGRHHDDRSRDRDCGHAARRGCRRHVGAQGRQRDRQRRGRCAHRYLHGYGRAGCADRDRPQEWSFRRLTGSGKRRCCSTRASEYGGAMFVTIAKVSDFGQFIRTFANEGAAKRREHGCRGAHVVRDPDDDQRVWVFFDWAQEDYEGFLADPDIPAIAWKLALLEPPTKVDPVARLEG